MCVHYYYDVVFFLVFDLVGLVATAVYCFVVAVWCKTTCGVVRIRRGPSYYTKNGAGTPLLFFFVHCVYIYILLLLRLLRIHII